MSDELYRGGRHSAPIRAPGENLHGQSINHELIAKLREIRNAGVDSVRADEQYEPDLCVELSDCATSDEVDQRLAKWREKRVETLDRVGKSLKDAWMTEHPSRSSGT